MSEENVELARRLYSTVSIVITSDAAGEALHATTEQIDRMVREDLDESFEIRLPADYPEGEPVFRGREGLDQLVAMLSESWREWRLEPERFLDADDRVVVFARIVGQGAASGVPFELETTHVWTFHEGRATSVQAYRNRSQALEAAGLVE